MRQPSTGSAISVKARSARFHRVALAAGFRDNGPPGERRYHPGYYGAFLLALDGNKASMAACRRAR